MIEIVRMGLAPSQKQYHAVCNKCQTEIKFLRYDATYVTDQRDGDFLKVSCPTCDNPITTTA